jgi:AcrR family transcriptional regulator
MQTDGKIKIIEAAQRLISKQGVEKTSMRHIAEEAGITTGAIYYYYKSKEELLYDVMDYAMSITSNIMEMSSKPEATPHEVLDEIARQVTQRLMKDNSARRLRYYLAYQAALGDEALRAKFASDYKAQAGRTARLFNYVFETDHKPEDISLAIIMIAALDGINLQQFMGALPVDPDEMARVYNEFFAYAVPNFQKNMDHIQRFDFLSPASKESSQE